MNQISERIISVIASIPAGSVASYGAVAAAAGLPNGARQVARLLHSASAEHNLPWWRVVRSDGKIALAPGYGFEEQAARLREEGVRVLPDGRVEGFQSGVAMARTPKRR
ncbi:MAG: MGMT family protein [Spirochaetales bacterium]|nr:MGMT family protein [Spirochaetales bacterium]